MRASWHLGKGNGTIPTNLWQPSVSVPFVLFDPTRTLPDHFTEPWSTVGIFDTVCEAVGAARPGDRWRAGESLYSALASANPGEVAILDEYGAGRMIRIGSWKLITRPGGPDELYDLASDPHEEHNLVDDPDHRARMQQMRVRLDEQFAPLTRPVYDAAHRDVTGFGQVLPVALGCSDAETYARGRT